MGATGEVGPPEGQREGWPEASAAASDADVPTLVSLRHKLGVRTERVAVADKFGDVSLDDSPTRGEGATEEGERGAAAARGEEPRCGTGRLAKTSSSNTGASASKLGVASLSEYEGRRSAGRDRAVRAARREGAPPLLRRACTGEAMT